MVDFKGNREVMIKHWITHPTIRKDFDIFFKMFKNRAFQDVSKRYSVPDHPPRHYFKNKKDCPTPLHNLETGLVQPDYLAFLCSQVMDEDSEMLKPQYNLELTHLALVLYVYGQNCISLHSSNIGLFRRDVYMAIAILANTAEIAAGPNKALTEVEDPDITDKLEELRANNRMIETSYSPYTTNARVVPKSRGPEKTLEFSKDSAILSYLLSLSEKQLDEIQQTSDALGERKKELEKDLVSEEDKEMYAEMIKQTNKELEELEEEKTRQRQDMSAEQGTQAELGEKVSRIRQRDKSRKIALGKPAKRDQRTSQGEENMEVITPTARIIITNIQGPKPKTERVWRKPSEEDKINSKKLWEPDPAGTELTSEKKVRFGFTRTIEYNQTEGDPEETDWRISSF